MRKTQRLLHLRALQIGANREQARVVLLQLGDGLVYDTKVKNGGVYLTQIHHRETPMFLKAGVTWGSEAIFQEQAGNPITHVDIPNAENTIGIYAGGIVKGAAHREAAREVARLSQITRRGRFLKATDSSPIPKPRAGTAVLQR